MNSKFNLSCCSTADVPYSYLESRDIPVLFYSYTIGDDEFVDDMGRDPEALNVFYGKVAAGALPRTSQINQVRYENFFEECLKKDGDLLHLAFGSGLSGSVNNARLAAEAMMEKYPDRRIVVIDTLAASSGYGMLVDYAADMRDAGRTLDETSAWVMDNRLRLHHQFFCSDLAHFRRSGRVSGTAATLGSLLGICPIMRLNDEGRIIAYSKVRGKKKAVAETTNVMLAHAENGADYDGKCFICNSNCMEEAEMLRQSIENSFPRLQGRIRICDIGCVIGSHCGPGTAAVFFLGDARLPG